MSDSTLPKYFVVDGVPVKWIATPSGGMDVLVYRMDTGDFVRDIEYLSACAEPGRDIERPDEAAFNAYVEGLTEVRRRMAANPDRAPES